MDTSGDYPVHVDDDTSVKFSSPTTVFLWINFLLYLCFIPFLLWAGRRSNANFFDFGGGGAPKNRGVSTDSGKYYSEFEKDLDGRFLGDDGNQGKFRRNGSEEIVSVGSYKESQVKARRSETSRTCADGRTHMLNMMTLGAVFRMICYVVILLTGRRGSIYSKHSASVDASLICKLTFWIREMLYIIPSLCFAKCFAMVVRFWILIDRTHKLSGMDLLTRSFKLTTSAGKVALTMLLCICAALQAYEAFHFLCIFSLSVIYLLLGITSFYYGMKMVGKFAPRPSDGVRGMKDDLTISVVHRILVLSLTCPVLWIARSGLDMILLYSVFFQSEKTRITTLASELVFRTFVYLATELIPSLIILAVFWSNQNTTGSLRSKRHNLSIEEPLMF